MKHFYRHGAFTLIEVLIAVAITAFIAVSAFAIMNQAIGTQESAENNDARLAELQRAMNRISMDMQQLAERQVRNQYGDLMPMLMGDKSAEDTYLSFTRQGKRNPANLPRTELERVTYRLEDDQLIREQWVVLDIVSEDQILKRPILDGVLKFEVEFFSDEQWVDSWPQSDIGNLDNNEIRTIKPRAVKVTLELDDLGELIQIYPLGIG